MTTQTRTRKTMYLGQMRTPQEIAELDILRNAALQEFAAYKSRRRSTVAERAARAKRVAERNAKLTDDAGREVVRRQLKAEADGIKGARLRTERLARRSAK